MDKTTALAKIMSEVSPLDEFSVTRSVKFVNRMCLIKTKNAIETGITGPSTHRDRGLYEVWYLWDQKNCPQYKRVRCLWCQLQCERLDTCYIVPQ